MFDHSVAFASVTSTAVPKKREMGRKRPLNPQSVSDLQDERERDSRQVKHWCRSVEVSNGSMLLHKKVRRKAKKSIRDLLCESTATDENFNGDYMITGNSVK